MFYQGNFFLKNSALKKIWKLNLSFIYFRKKYDIKLKKLLKTKKDSMDYFKNDLAAVQEQAFLMVKTRIGSIIEEVKTP